MRLRGTIPNSLPDSDARGAAHLEAIHLWLCNLHTEMCCYPDSGRPLARNLQQRCGISKRAVLN